MTMINAKRKEDRFENTFESGVSSANTVHGMMSQISEKAQELGSDVVDKTDEALSSVGGKITNFAGSIRESASAQGTFATVAGSIADKLESSGHYLTTHGVSEMADGVTGIVRKYPVRSLWVGVGLGVLLGAALSRKSSRGAHNA